MENRSILQRFIARPEFGPFILLVMMIVVFQSINPSFLSLQNISNTLAFTVELGLIALAMTLLMTSGEFDLSVGSVFGFSAVLMWTLFNAEIMPLGLSFLVTLLVAAAIGFFNGIFILRLMRNGIIMVGVPGLAYNIFIGAIILGMMALHSWLERRHKAGT